MYIESEDYKNAWELADQCAGENQQKTDFAITHALYGDFSI